MNQRFDPKENRPVDPAAWPSDATNQRGEPLSAVPPLGTTLNDPIEQRRVDAIDPPVRSRSTWPLLIILLAGVVLAMLVWLPSEVTTTPTDTATPPAATAPAPDTAVTPAAPAPDTATTPQTAPATPDAPAPATQTPTTGADQQPQTNGTATQPAP